MKSSQAMRIVVLSSLLILSIGIQETVGGPIQRGPVLKRSPDEDGSSSSSSSKDSDGKELFKDRNLARMALLEWANNPRTKGGGGDEELTDLTDEGLLEELTKAAEAFRSSSSNGGDLVDPSSLAALDGQSLLREALILKDRLQQEPRSLEEEEKGGSFGLVDAGTGPGPAGGTEMMMLPKSRNSRNRLMHQVELLEKLLSEQLNKESSSSGSSSHSKRAEGPQLSVTGPLDAIRRQLLLQYMHRQMQKTEKQIEENRKILENIGKRSIPDSELATLSSLLSESSSNDDEPGLSPLLTTANAVVAERKSQSPKGKSEDGVRGTKRINYWKSILRPVKRMTSTDRT